MCSVSYIADDWQNRMAPRLQDIRVGPIQFFPKDQTAEIAELRREMEELKKLLKAAKEYDTNTGQPDCEMADKVKFLRDAANLLGVDLSNIFPA